MLYVFKKNVNITHTIDVWKYSFIILLKKTKDLKMFIVAITGGIATGKSTVCETFQKCGVAVIDADEIAKSGTYPIFCLIFFIKCSIIEMQLVFI